MAALGLLAVTTANAAPPRTLNLSQAIEQHIVTIQTQATGSSYTERGLNITVKNTGSLAFNLVMDQGVLFTPDSGSYQPLILAGEEMLPIQPLKEAKMTVQTFCANSSANAPIANLKYTYAGVTKNDTLKQVLGYIKQNRLFNDLGQSAVWMFTNGHSLRSVYESNNEPASKKLVAYIANLTGQPIPEYYVENATSTLQGAPVYTPKTLKIYAQFEQKLEEPKKLTLGVYNGDGNMIQPVFENRPFGKAGHRFKVTFEAKDVPAGKYYIRLQEGDAVLQETTVTVE